MLLYLLSAPPKCLLIHHKPMVPSIPRAILPEPELYTIAYAYYFHAWDFLVSSCRVQPPTQTCILMNWFEVLQTKNSIIANCFANMTILEVAARNENLQLVHSHSLDHEGAVSTGETDSWCSSFLHANVVFLDASFLRAVRIRHLKKRKKLCLQILPQLASSL